MMAPPRRLCAALAMLLAVVVPGAVHGHAVLLDSSPAADAALPGAPAEVLLRFNEPVRPIGVQVLIAKDQVALRVEVEVVDTMLRARLPAEAPDGIYVVSYRVTSADGHPVAGSLVFTAGEVGATPVSVRPDIARFEWIWRIAAVGARSLWYGALLLAAGLALFLAILPVPAGLEPTLRRALGWLALVGLAAGLPLLGATGGALQGGAPGALLTSDSWRLALASPVAVTIAIAVSGLGVLALSTRPQVHTRRALRLTGALLVALSFGASGHAATAGPRWLTLPVLTLHGLCAAYWVGAFAPLLLALRRLPGDQALVLLRAFSGRAIVAVVCLVLAGIVLSVVQLRALSVLITTDYGRLLLLKLALVGILLGLAAINRLILTPAVERRHDAARWLRRTIGADLVFVAGVVALTAGLGTVPPPRTLAERAAAHAHAGHGPREYTAQVVAQDHNLVVVASPAHIGKNRIDLYLTNRQGHPVAAKAAELSFALPEMGIEALRVDAAPLEPGHFQAGINLPLAGDWGLRAELLVDDFTKLPFQARIVVARSGEPH
jgi:copper transport protein